MKHSIIKTQKGIGLIEVLIATVVVAVGLLAVASLQGKFMSSSGGSKTRAEAQVLAEQKLEALRNNVTITGYRDLNADGVVDAATITATDSPVGTNASFTRTWTITDVAPPVPPFTAADPKLRKISVQVGWDANGDGTITPPDETVNVVTEMAWIDPAKAAEYAAANAGGSTSVASPRQNASEDVAAEKVIGGTALTIPSGVTAGTATSINVTVPATTTSSGGSVTIYQVGPGSHYYTLTDSTFVSPGVIAVFLCTTTCTHIQNHFGGVVHRIAGTVHSTSSNGFTNIKVAWTSSSVNDCYNGDIAVVSGSGSDQYRYRPYECIYAGNCNATADGVNGCFPDSVVSDDQINARKVGPGGEYGDVGLLGVDDQGGDREQVCLLEDTVDPATSPLLAVSGSAVLNENYLYSVTKRFYAARRIKRNTATSINDQKTEGINHSYTNHNFLVISRGTGATANQLCNLKATAKFIRLAPREIFKTLDQSASNTVLAITDFVGAAGTAKTLTGTVTSDATKLKLIIPDVGNCYLNNNTNAISAATAYACAVPNGMASVDIKGGSNEYPTITPNAVFATCTKTDATTCNWRGNFTQVATQSNDCTAPWGAAVISGSGVTAYQNEIEPFGGTCMPQTRTCSGTPGVLSGTYTNQACTVAASADCASPFAGGATITNGGSVNAYSIASVPFGFTCPAFVVRTCTSGILSGSGTFATCTVQSTRDITVTATQTGTGTVSGITVTGTGATCAGLTCTVDNAWTGTLTATGTCSGGGTVTGTSASIIASATSATITLGNCTGPVCTLPWGGSIASGGTVAAYSSATVPYPSTCASISETRYCTNGALSGNYMNQSCSVVCTVPTINGMPTTNAANIAAVAAAITNAGFTVGTATDIGSGTKAVSLQSPAAGSTAAACGSAITYTYN